MTRPTILTLAYLGIAAFWQYILWTLWPNVGMGGLAIVYLVWPSLAVSAGLVWFAIRHSQNQSARTFWAITCVMLIMTYALHPNAG
jgi:hypothetical protein